MAGGWSVRKKYLVGGAVAVGISWLLLPGWVTLLLLAALVGLPMIAYAMLDESQRRRLRQRRREIGR